MSKQPTTSILIPVYNREDLIADCITSAQNQTVQDIEIIIADNASTDNTWEICRQFAEKDPRIKIFRNETNIGPVLNWQRCIDEARGLYGKILFSDDTMSPTFLERALPMMENNDVGFVFSSIEIGTQQGMGGEICWWRKSSGLYSSKRFLTEALCEATIPVSPGAGIFRMADLRQNLLSEIPSPMNIDFTVHGAGPDLLIILLTARDYKKVGYLAEPLVFFRHHDDSITIREDGGLINSHHYQAKVWFAEQLTAERSNLLVTPLQLCLAFGWRQQYKKRKIYEPKNSFSSKFTNNPPELNFLTFVFLRIIRWQIKVSRQLSHFFRI